MKIKTMGTFDPVTRNFRRISKWYKKGVSDIIGIYKGKFLAIEVKLPKRQVGEKTYAAGRLSPFQKIFLQDVIDHGGIAFVATSADEVEQKLGEFDEGRMVAPEPK
jgi:penicillin-binding protein-related factor A (putative recombinase)